MDDDVVFPASTNTVRVRMFDTTTRMATGAEYFVYPVRAGHETLNLSSVGFLIDNPQLGQRVVYDLGCRKEFWRSPPPLVSRMSRILAGLRVEREASEVLEEAGIDLKSIDAVIWSHAHFDHTGDITTFPSSTKLVVGPGFREAFLPAYPTDPESRLDESFFRNRDLVEIDLDRTAVEGKSLEIAGFAAIDFFGDGSFYLLSAPGHCVGHICALARTTPDTFVFMGGDICHSAGVLRPTMSAPLPSHASLPSRTALTHDDGVGTRACRKCCGSSPAYEQHVGTSDGETVMSAAAATTTTTDGRDERRQRPIYEISRSEHSAYIDRARAVADVAQAQRLDASPHVLTCLAHDTALLEVLPTLKHYDDEHEGVAADLNDWKDKGWKERLQWRFLSELPHPDGRRGRDMIVEGFWREGRLVESIH